MNGLGTNGREETVRGLARRVLGRFPQHLEADGRGKRLGVLVDALAADLERLGVSLAGVRRARRPTQADETLDLRRLGALHGLDDDELALLELRALPLAERVAALRARLVGLARLHAAGNGTVRALFEGAALAADLEPAGTVLHSADRFWHGLWCIDRLGADGAPRPVRLVLEETPLEERVTPPTPRHHGARWSLSRDGFGPAAVDVRVEALGERTLGVLAVQRERGVALGMSHLPPGETLVFGRDGEARLEGEDSLELADRAFVVTGGIYSEDGESPAVEWRFAGDAEPTDDSGDGSDSRVARFAVSTPFADLPDAARRRLELPVGTTHLAVFVRRRSFVAADAEVPAAHDLPRFDFGAFDRIGFAADEPTGEIAAEGPAEEQADDAPAATVSLAWAQHRPFSVRLWLPKHLRELAESAGMPPSDVLAGMRRAVRRVQPAGVEVDVVFVDDGLADDGLADDGLADDASDTLRPMPDDLAAAFEATTPQL
ncbi:MAG: hypothetical protein AAGC60_20445 [Acidobacteriota bacterium]